MSEKQDRLEKVKADIANGKLTYPQIQKRLAAVIRREYKKEGGPDIDLVNACEDLLWRLGTDNAPFVTHEDEYKEAMRSRIEASQRARQIKKPVLRFVAALVVVVLLLGGAEVFLHHEWIGHTNTEDQQQHIVQGYVIDPDLVTRVIADENGDKTIITTSYQEIRDSLGFDLPQNVFIKNWEPEYFYLSISPKYIKIVIVYSQEDDQQSQLVLDLRIFTSIEEAYVPYEQDKNGITRVVGTVPVYFSSNYDDNTAIWTINNCAYWLNSNIEKNMLDEIVQQMIGGKQYE